MEAGANHGCRAPAAAFVSTIRMKLRPLDILRLVIGRTIQRDSEGWAIYTRASKNRYKLVGRLWDICTPYLDGAIVLGADESQLRAAYARAEGRPLLAERDGKALDENWATEQFRRQLGTGVGIMRTLWHDLCAAHGTELALRRRWPSAGSTIRGRRSTTARG